jgi:hypothetical protein
MFEQFLKTETEKQKHSEEIIGLLTDSATVSALKAERQAKINTDRRAALEGITAVERERDETLPPLFEQLQAARLRIEEINIKYKAEMKEACSERDKADYEHNRAKFRIDNAIERDRRLLRDTAAAELDELWRWLLAEDDKARNACDVKLGIKRNPFAGASRLVNSNAGAIAQRRAAIKAAMHRIEEMRFEVVEDVAAEIAKLKASIPADAYPADEIEEVLPPPPRDEAPHYTDNAKDDRPKIAVPEISWLN